MLHGETPDVFRYLKVKQFSKIFDDESDTSKNDRDVIYQMVFEKGLAELTPSTVKMLDDLLELVRNEKISNSGSCSYTELGVQLLEYLSRVSAIQCLQSFETA